METLIEILKTDEVAYFSTCLLACAAYILGVMVGATGQRREILKRLRAKGLQNEGV